MNRKKGKIIILKATVYKRAIHQLLKGFKKLLKEWKLDIVKQN